MRANRIKTVGEIQQQIRVARRLKRAALNGLDPALTARLDQSLVFDTLAATPTNASILSDSSAGGCPAGYAPVTYASGVVSCQRLDQIEEVTVTGKRLVSYLPYLALVGAAIVAGVYLSGKRYRPTRRRLSR